MSKKSCWSWRHRIHLNSRLTDNQLSTLVGFCQATFGYDRAYRYDITFRQRRINSYSFYPRYYYTHVKVHFKRQEDLFIFKLTYNS